RPVFAVEPALQKTRHEPVAGAKDVEHFDREAGAEFSIVEAVRDGSAEGDRAERAALGDERGVRDGAHGLQRRHCIGRAAGDVKLLFGSDDEVEEVKARLHLRGDLLALDEATLALAVPCHAPEVRVVVDVERSLDAGLAGDSQRTAASVSGWLRCVPVTTTDRADRTKSSSMSSSQSAMSAQFSR